MPNVEIRPAKHSYRHRKLNSEYPLQDRRTLVTDDRPANYIARFASPIHVLQMEERRRPALC